MAGITEILLKSQCIKFNLQSLTLALAKEGQRGLEKLEERLGTVALGRELRK